MKKISRILTLNFFLIITPCLKCDNVKDSPAIESKDRINLLIDEVFKENDENSEPPLVECPKDHCVPYHLCSENNTIIRDGKGFLDTR